MLYICVMELKTHPTDHRYIFLTGTKREGDLLTKHLNKVPMYQLLPNYPYPVSPEVFLDRVPGKDAWYCSAGLWKEVVDFTGCNRPMSSVIYTPFSLSKEEFRELISSWSLNIQPRDYQIDAAWLILKYRLSLSELATRAGKTLIFYLVARTAMEVLGVQRILLIVPSIQLVKQGIADLKDYGDFFSTDEVWGGSISPSSDSVEMGNLTIGTFQSVVLRADPRSKRYDPTFFSHDMVVVDECHKLPCKSIKHILSLYRDLKLKFGFTGTLPKSNTIEWLACQAMMGPKIQEIRTDELVDEGFLARPRIIQVRIDGEDHFERSAEYLVSVYREKDRKKILLPKDQRLFTMVHEKDLPMAYSILRGTQGYRTSLLSGLKEKMQVLQCEQLQAMQSASKIDYIKTLLDPEKNTIVFAHNVEYIDHLANELGTPYKITGATSLKKRQEIIQRMDTEQGMVVVAGYGVLSTGVTIRNVQQAIMAQSFKSEIVNIQAIGRGLLKHNKEEFLVYDLIDVYPTGKILAQGKAKINIYKERNYDYEIIEVKNTGSTM